MDHHKIKISISKRRHLSEQELEKKIEDFLSGDERAKTSAHSHEKKRVGQAVFLFLHQLKNHRHVERLRSFLKLEGKKMSIRYSFSSLKKIVAGTFSKKTRYTASVVVLLLVLSCIVYYRKYIASAATFMWVQSSWTGGAATGAPYPLHPTNESGWNKYYSKGGIDTTSGITLEKNSN
jgi:hypothetical protein